MLSLPVAYLSICKNMDEKNSKKKRFLQIFLNLNYH